MPICAPESSTPALLAVVLASPLLRGEYDSAALSDAATTLALAQAGAVASEPTANIWLVTSGVHLVGSERRVARPKHAGVWGLARVARVEMPSASIDSIDVVPPVHHGLRALVGIMDSAQASCEIASRGSTQFEVRLRRGATVRASAVHPMVTAGAEIVITGGLGGLGLNTTPWLLSHGARTVVLTSRSGQVARDGQGLGVLPRFIHF